MTVVPRLLRRAEAAVYLGISIAMLDSLRSRGEIAAPVPMPGRKDEPIRTPLFDRQDLDAAIEKWKANGRAPHARPNIRTPRAWERSA